jgi:hypothetical protein
MSSLLKGKLAPIAVAALLININAPALAQENKDGASGKTAQERLVPSASLKNESPALAKQAPYAASAKRVAVIVYGGDNSFLKAAYSGAEDYERNTGRPAYFLYANPEEGTPSNVVMIKFFANGVEHSSMKVTNPQDFVEIRKEVTKSMHAGYEAIIKSKIVESVSGESHWNRIGNSVPKRLLFSQGTLDFVGV